MEAVTEFTTKVEALAQVDPVQLVALLKKGPPVVASPEFKNLLDGALDVRVHSLGWLEVLDACKHEPDRQFFMHKSYQFLQNCDGAQVSHSTAKFAEVAATFARHFIDAQNPMHAILPLQAAMEKLREGPQYLTAVHHEFIKLCVKAQCYTAALPTLDEDVLFLPSEGKFNALHLLCYYYYGGMAYCAVKKFDRALEFFSVAISVPADSVSSVMVEAYKKYSLVCLLLHGKFVDLPPYASFVLRQIKQLTQPYQELMTAHKTNNVEKFNEQLAKHNTVLAADKNLGLAKQVGVKMTRCNIKKLTETFLTLSLTAIAERVKLADAQVAETALVSMINDYEIHATIDQLTGTVCFHDDDEQYDTEATMQKLKSEVEATAALFAKIKKLDVELRTAPKFIKRMQSPNDGPGGTTDIMDFQYDGGSLGF